MGAWTEDTVDNEHMNKKKSKKCCIYSKPRAFGESSSESEGSSSGDDGAAKPIGYKKKNRFCPFGQYPGGPRPEGAENGGSGDSGASSSNAPLNGSSGSSL